jgi:hypothetical protein
MELNAMAEFLSVKLRRSRHSLLCDGMLLNAHAATAISPHSILLVTQGGVSQNFSSLAGSM